MNPYLSLSVLLAAMRDGIERELDPGVPEERNIYEAMEAGKEVKRLPMTRRRARRFGGGRSGQRRAPGDMYRVFMHYKRDEWERHCAQVSDWDVKIPRRPALGEGAKTCAESQGSSTATGPTRSGAT